MAKPYPKPEPTPKKKPKRVRAVSVKREAENILYHKNKKKYLKEFITCEVRECGNKSTEVHHKSGRIGQLIHNTLYFLATCRSCHRYIEDNPFWSKEQGYSLNRL